VFYGCTGYQLAISWPCQLASSAGYQHVRVYEAWEGCPAAHQKHLVPTLMRRRVCAHMLGGARATHAASARLRKANKPAFTSQAL
jgi:hypothetical protein